MNSQFKLNISIKFMSHNTTLKIKNLKNRNIKNYIIIFDSGLGGLTI